MRIELQPRQLRDEYIHASSTRSKSSQAPGNSSPLAGTRRQAVRTSGRKPLRSLSAATATTIPLVTRAQSQSLLHRAVQNCAAPSAVDQTMPAGPPRWSANNRRTVGMLIMLHGSWRRAVSHRARRSRVGCRNETAWAVVASAAGRGIPDDVVWELFDRHFRGWDGVSESQIASMMERTRPVLRSLPMIFIAPTSTGGVNANAKMNRTATSDPGADNVIPFKRARFRTRPESNGRERDDDELVRTAKEKIAEWKTTSRQSQPDTGAGAVSRVDLRGRERHGARQDRGRRRGRLR